MSQTLFEKLSYQGISQNRPDDKLVLITSIQNNLKQLLNSRQGSLPHLPDYGLPDLGEVYRGMPNSIETLLSNIVIAINKYEPRLRNAQAFEKSLDDLSYVLSVEITAELLSGESLVFETYFSGDGEAYLQKI